MLPTCELQDQLILRFQGRLDTARCTQIESQVRDMVASPAAPVIFDLDGVDFVCSSFLRLCVFAKGQAAGLGFQITNVHPSIKRVLKIAGLDSMLQRD